MVFPYSSGLGIVIEPAHQLAGGELVGSVIEIVSAGRDENQVGCRILALSFRHDPRFQDPASFDEGCLTQSERKLRHLNPGSIINLGLRFF